MFCGLATTLHAEYGLPLRLLANRDATFLVLLSLAQQPSGSFNAAFQTCCNPLGTKQRVVGRGAAGAALSFAAAASVCGLRAKLEDDAQDSGGLWARLAAAGASGPLLRWHFARAERVLERGGLDVEGVWAGLGNQHAIERAMVEQWTLEKSPSLQGAHPSSQAVVASRLLGQAAGPTAQAFSALFKHTATLAGGGGGGMEGARVLEELGSNRAALGQLGASLGQLVYALDALEDYNQDIKDGGFNPLQGALSSVVAGEEGGDVCGEVLRGLVVPYAQAQLDDIQHALHALHFPAAAPLCGVPSGPFPPVLPSTQKGGGVVRGEVHLVNTHMHTLTHEHTHTHTNTHEHTRKLTQTHARALRC